MSKYSREASPRAVNSGIKKLETAKKDKLLGTNAKLNVYNSKINPKNEITTRSFTDCQVNEIKCVNRFTPLASIHQHVVEKADTSSSDVAHSNDNGNFQNDRCQKRLNRGHTVATSNTAVTNRVNVPRDVSTEGVDSNTSSWDKYSHALRYVKAKNYKNVMSGCKILKKWDEQNKFKFGFIPLGDLKMPDEYSPSPLGVAKDLITLHKKLRASDQMNFMSVQTHVPSQLNPEVWECLLKNYWDVQLPLLIRHGFPLDFNRDSILESHTENHTSATEFPHDVQAYLDEETNHGAI